SRVQRCARQRDGEPARDRVQHQRWRPTASRGVRRRDDRRARITGNRQENDRGRGPRAKTEREIPRDPVDESRRVGTVADPQRHPRALAQGPAEGYRRADGRDLRLAEGTLAVPHGRPYWQGGRTETMVRIG